MLLKIIGKVIKVVRSSFFAAAKGVSFVVWKFYESYLKFLMWVPLALLVLASAVLASNFFTTGYFVQRGVELEGGKVITVAVKDADAGKIKIVLPYASVRVSEGAQKTLTVEVPGDKNETEIIEELGKLVVFDSEPSVKFVGPVVAEIFFQQAQTAVVLAFVMMSVVVFLLFRSFVPSALVILAATTDIIITLAVISLLGVKFSLPVLGALLAIIGYSVDTDILLTTELLKGDRQQAKEGVKRAVKTGVTLTSAAIVALLALYFLSGSAVLQEIAGVLIIGLLVDMPATWFTNAGFLVRWMGSR